jgi:hypothetical protein
MGRRKKENCFPYKDIVVSTYIKSQDYQKAQLQYSNNISTDPTIDLNSVDDFIDADMEDFNKDESY